VLALRRRAFVVLSCVLGALSGARGARADNAQTLEGRWAAGPLTVRWVIGDWGQACGPKPAGGGEPGAAVVIQQSGTELVITGGGRTYSTTQCWEQYPGIQRTGHSSSPRSWKTSCRTAAADPRQAALTTSLTATDDSISFYEAGQYQFVINGQNCTASIGRYRTYTLVQRAGTPDTVAPPATTTTATATAPKEAPKKVEPAQNRCTSPGPPARLEVRPVRKLVRASEEFTFRAIVSDASGCLLGAHPTWTIDSGSDHADLAQTGTVHVHPDAPEGEIQLNAAVGGRSAAVTVEIASTDRYESLLHSGAFNANGEVDEAASVAIASQSIGAASAVAEDRATGRKKIFVGFVGGIALALVAASLVLLRRSRAAEERRAKEEEARRARKKKTPEPVMPPTQRSPEPSSPHAAPAPPAPAPAPAPVPVKRGTICPMCGMEYGPESRFCGKDGATLVPLN
jgi:hypothetical protein